MTARGIAEIEWSMGGTASGEPALRIGGRSVNGAEPRREAEARARRITGEMRERGANLLIALGPGLGYVYEELLSAVDVPILLWDPFPALTRALPVPPSFQDHHLRVVSDPGGFDNAVAELVGPGVRPSFFVHPGYEETAQFEARYMIHAIRRGRHRSGPCTERPVISRRSLDFLTRFPFLHTIAELRDKLTAQTVVLVAAGPSLQLAVDALAGRSGGAVIAAAQALSVLDGGGARAEFCIAGDPADYSSMVGGLGRAYDAILADTSAAPSFLDKAPERTFLFHLRTPHVHQLAWEEEGLPVIDEPFATVSDVLLVVAHALGARRFVLVGVDLDSTEPRYHCRFKVPGSEGHSTWTNATYFHSARYLGWLCPRLVAAGCTIWRVGSGLPISGTRHLDPDELFALLDTSPPFEAPVPAPAHCEDRRARALRLIETLLADDYVDRAGHDDARPDLGGLVGPERKRACAAAHARLSERG